MPFCTLNAAFAVASATFVGGEPPVPEGFLLVSPSRVDVTLQRA